MLRFGHLLTQHRGQLRRVGTSVSEMHRLTYETHQHLFLALLNRRDLIGEAGDHVGTKRC